MRTRDRLPSAGYATDPRSLAVALLGCTLVRITDDGTRLAGRIVETEAYCGPEDQAAHTRNGHRSARNEVMYGKPGLVYVYFTYGMHHCMNVVCGEVDLGVAVLLRALEPVDGLDRMLENRTGTKPRKHPLRERDLCSGPARLCQAFGLSLDDNGRDLTADPALWIERAEHDAEPGKIVNTARIGVDSAGEWATKPLRWYLAESAHVSRR